MYPPGGGLRRRGHGRRRGGEQAAGLHDEAVAIAKEAGVGNVETVVASGRGWDGALRGIDWAPGDVLVFGSSRLGQLARVFLGSTASKILRHTPVPALVIPSGTTTWSCDPPGRLGQRRSTMVATPMPPPTHKVIRP